MKKKILALLFATLICCTSMITAFAAEDVYIYDGADLLTDEEYDELDEKIRKASKDSDLIINIITDDYISDYSPDESSDCVCLLISMDERDVMVKSNGSLGSEALPDSECQKIIDEITDELSDGDYAQAFDEYIDLVEEAVYDVNHFNIAFNILVSIGIGLVVALIVVLVMKSQLKSVRFQSAAANYLKDGSLQVSNANDVFLYRHVNRVAKPKNNSSSSGGSGGSASGKF